MIRTLFWIFTLILAYGWYGWGGVMIWAVLVLLLGQKQRG